MEVLLTVPLGFTVPDVLMQLSPVETADCLTYLGCLIGRVRGSDAERTLRDDSVKELLIAMEERYEKRYIEEKRKEMMLFEDRLREKHEQAVMVCRCELTHEIDKLKVEKGGLEKAMESLERQVRLETCVELAKQKEVNERLLEVNERLRLEKEEDIFVKVEGKVESYKQSVRNEISELRTQKEVNERLLLQMKESHSEEMSSYLKVEKANFDRQVTLEKQARESQIDLLQRSHVVQIGQLNEQINDLKEQVQKLTVSRTTNTSQGQEGEVEVAELFKSAMKGCILEWEDTTSIEGSGDGKAIILRNDEEYKVLVEAKNVKVLHSKKDTAKFHKDVAKQKPDFALMISIQEKSIPKMYKLEFIDCIPTITIESRCENLIRLCVDYLVYVAQSKRQERKERKGAARFSEHIDLLFTHILDLELSLEEKAENIEAARKLLDADRTRILDMRMQMDRFLNIYPAHTAKSTMDLALDEIKPELTKKSDYVHREQLELFNRAGGFPAVKAEFKKRKLHHCEPE